MSAVERVPMEWSFTSGKTYKDAFNEIELDVIITDPGGTEQRVPAFWDGDQVWRVRYSAPAAGRYTYTTICSDTSNAGLHGQTGSIDVAPYSGSNPLYRHGPIRVASCALAILWSDPETPLAYRA